MIDIKNLISCGIVCEGVVWACSQEFQTATVATVLDVGES
jgi:hypothetical protein